MRQSAVSVEATDWCIRGGGWAVSEDRCTLVEQGVQPGDCLVHMPDGSRQRACRATLRSLDGVLWRLIRSAHLSRPEHYLSI